MLGVDRLVREAAKRRGDEIARGRSGVKKPPSAKKRFGPSLAAPPVRARPLEGREGVIGRRRKCSAQAEMSKSRAPSFVDAGQSRMFAEDRRGPFR